MLVYHSKKWPLLVDPDRQAEQWINALALDKLVVTSFGQNNFAKQVILALKQGKFLLIENIESLNSDQLDPILQKQLYSHKGRLFLDFEGESVEYHASF